MGLKNTNMQFFYIENTKMSYSTQCEWPAPIFLYHLISNYYSLIFWRFSHMARALLTYKVNVIPGRHR